MQLLLHQGLFAAFDVYLVVVTVATAVLRVGFVRKVIRTVRQLNRWPRVARLLVGHLELLLGPRMLAPIFAYATVFLANALARTFLFPEVVFSFSDVVRQPLLLLPVLPMGWVMVRQDLRSLGATSADFDEAWVARTLTVAEAVLGTLEQAERLLPSGREGLLHDRVVKPVSRAGIEILFLPDANRWVGSLVVQTSTKLLFGACVWMTWALFLA